MKCVATATDTPGDDPRFGPWGKQRCEDTGPLTKKRMETIDEEFLKSSFDFIDRAVRDKKPFFVWFNPTRMHIWTRLKPASQGKTGLGIYPDGMVEHDGQVGELLKKLDDLGIADNTIRESRSTAPMRSRQVAAERERGVGLKHDDRRPQVSAVTIVAGVAHDGDDLVDRRRVGWVPHSLFSRWAAGVIAGQGRRRAPPPRRVEHGKRSWVLLRSDSR